MIKRTPDELYVTIKILIKNSKNSKLQLKTKSLKLKTITSERCMI